MPRTSAKLLYAFLLLVPLLNAQETTTLQVETHLIDTTFSVHDAQGRLVTSLGQRDFTVSEDSVPQKIRFFRTPSTMPLSIGLVIDGSGSQSRFVKQHERDIEAFLKELLGPSDQAFALCFGNHLRLVSDLTGSAPLITEGIRRFDKGNRDFP